MVLVVQRCKLCMEMQPHDQCCTFLLNSYHPRHPTWMKCQLWARGVPQLFATTAVRLAELVLLVRFELIASRSLTQFLCKIYAFRPFWSCPSCTCYVSYVGIKENLLGLVLRFQKIRTEKYVFYFEKYIFFA